MNKQANKRTLKVACNKGGISGVAIMLAASRKRLMIKKGLR